MFRPLVSVSPLDANFVTLTGRYVSDTGGNGDDEANTDTVLFGWPLTGFSISIAAVEGGGGGNVTALLTLPADDKVLDANTNGAR